MQDLEDAETVQVRKRAVPEVPKKKRAKPSKPEVGDWAFAGVA
jgi:hypothetical protein